MFIYIIIFLKIFSTADYEEEKENFKTENGANTEPFYIHSVTLWESWFIKKYYKYY